MKRTFSTIWSVGLLATLWVLLAPASWGGSSSFVIVAGASMEPTLWNGDLVWIREAADYRAGDIVAFNSGQGMVIHRIIGESSQGFIVKGDNKEDPDRWTPKEEDVLGKKMVHIPQAGDWVSTMQANPVYLGAIGGGLTSLGIWTANRKTRRHGAHAVNRRRRARRSELVQMAQMRGVVLVLLTLLVAVATLAGALAYLLQQPRTQKVVVETRLYDNLAVFDYRAEMAPSIIYGADTIAPTSDGTPESPIYSQLLRQLKVTMDYSAVANDPSEFSGSIAGELRIQAGEEGWMNHLALGEERPFTDGTGLASFVVDWSRVRALVERAEEETGIAPGTYFLTVAANIEVRNEGSQSELFRAELPMEFTDQELSIPADALAVTQPVVDKREEVRPNRIDVLGLEIPVREAVVGVSAVLVILVGAAIFYAGRTLQRLGGGELARLRLRYGQLIVPVSGDFAPEGTTMEVTSMADLAHLARKAEQMVFYHRVESQHRFFVPDGSLVYEFRIDRRGNELRRA
ncbi:MAG TPA: signal peptidase I [Acidimicrobiia bacterium]|nr:signal peptidase I [Acidimicrobiia bacterium]